MSTVENQGLTDEQVSIALKIIGVIQPHSADNVITAMVSIISHAISQSDDPDGNAQFWANTLRETVNYALKNGDRPHSGGSIQ
ncbi:MULTISPECIES: hypothetical protein [unclassified Agrobacterium]|uniref:hypothetical protein n=1 Tax=unclassified Agrobacterium TaxID=2632611 RepID=UPI00244AC3EE|nr:MULTISPECIES: hypothetical protein [unclassified Agrobacterium]MDH0613626.1 hypothetical protein [Agrobacterium sp. GD03872]MDH0696515.1 hypothetical protein [Agrobacterium sp. GD03871]MDH1059827.1 hypothetical protein [Agrobacterium sp. GD03992]MDH2210236.1 hypothetical protein [Agrobacterium sp. GD03643]MDH2219735.1 hypothetical protein [Agrobacterium sp. GD03638]